MYRSALNQKNQKKKKLIIEENINLHSRHKKIYNTNNLVQKVLKFIEKKTKIYTLDQKFGTEG